MRPASTVKARAVLSSAPPPSTAPTAHPTQSSSAKEKAAYARGLRTLRSFLSSWHAHGLSKAAHQYLEAEYQPPRSQKNPGLQSWTVLSHRPAAWASPDRFTLAVDMRMRFTGGTGAWTQGVNTRFVTFTRPSGSNAGYRIGLATSP